MVLDLTTLDISLFSHSCECIKRINPLCLTDMKNLPLNFRGRWLVLFLALAATRTTTILSSISSITQVWADVFEGTEGPDVIVCTLGDDKIDSKGGSDRNVGLSGNDRIDSGDEIDANFGDSFVDHGSGDDIIISGDGFDIISSKPVDLKKPRIIQAIKTDDPKQKVLTFVQSLGYANEGLGARTNELYQVMIKQFHLALGDRSEARKYDSLRCPKSSSGTQNSRDKTTSRK